MKAKLVELLRCPVSGGRLRVHRLDVAPVLIGAGGGGDKAGQEDSEVQQGFLHCAESGLLYPVIAGVPRMIRNAYTEYNDFFYQHRARLGTLEGQEEAARRLGQLDPRRFDQRSQESFSLQWQKYDYKDKTWFKDDEKLRRDEFLYNLQLRAEDLPGKLLLDAGCGNGHLTATMASYGAEVVGLDFSGSVERAAAQFPQVHFVQGNILEPPFAPATFDHIHSSGVLHHTPDPRGAFDRFVTLVRPGGRVFVQLYRRRRDLVGRLNAPLRSVTTRLPLGFLWRLCNVAVPMHTMLVKAVARIRGEPTQIGLANQRERAVSLFDNFSPPYQFRYDPEEIHRWFTEARLREVQDVTLANEARHMLAFVGTR